jgi:hypothetical protein
MDSLHSINLLLIAVPFSLIISPKAKNKLVPFISTSLIIRDYIFSLRLLEHKSYNKIIKLLPID